MRRAVVLDNSAVCRFRFGETNARHVEPLIRAIEEFEVVAYAPQHLLVEFFHVARRRTTDLKDSRRAVKRHYDWLMSLPIQYLPVDYLQSARELRLLVDQGAGSYDAIYIHLAQRQNVELCTCDRGIANLHARGLRFKLIDLHRTMFAQ